MRRFRTVQTMRAADKRVSNAEMHCQLEVLIVNCVDVERLDPEQLARCYRTKVEKVAARIDRERQKRGAML